MVDPSDEEDVRSVIQKVNLSEEKTSWGGLARAISSPTDTGLRGASVLFLICCQDVSDVSVHNEYQLNSVMKISRT